MTYKQAITYLSKNEYNNEFKKTVATQIVGIRTAQEIERIKQTEYKIQNDLNLTIKELELTPQWIIDKLKIFNTADEVYDYWHRNETNLTNAELNYCHAIQDVKDRKV